MQVYQSKETYLRTLDSTSEYLPTGVIPAIYTPVVNRIRYLFGLKCQSTVHNQTDEVVYAIVSNRIMGTANTMEMNANVGATPAAKCALEFGKTMLKGPTPVTIVPIAHRKVHTFNVDSRSYYLTCFTDKETGLAFHLLNQKVKGYNDYVIASEVLQHRVDSELAQESMKMIGLAIKKYDDPIREPATEVQLKMNEDAVVGDTEIFNDANVGMIGIVAAVGIAAAIMVWIRGCSTFSIMD